jgi:hypothetical protein
MTGTALCVFVLPFYFTLLAPGSLELSYTYAIVAGLTLG